MNEQPDCIFCKIIAGQAPASFVYQDEQVIGIMSLDQPNPFKVLIIPKAHREMIYDLSDDLAGQIFTATAKVARAIRKASKCPGLNVIQSNGRLGQQDVFHFHLHLLPRFEDDPINLNWPHESVSRSELAEMASEIRACIEP